MGKRGTAPRLFTIVTNDACKSGRGSKKKKKKKNWSKS